MSIVLKSQIIPVYWTRSPLFSIWTFLLIVWFQLLCILILAIFRSILIFISVLPLLCSCFISLDHLFGGYRFWLILFPLLYPCAIHFSSNSAYLYSFSFQVFVCFFFSSKSCRINRYLFSLPSPTGQELQTEVWLPLVFSHLVTLKYSVSDSVKDEIKLLSIKFLFCLVWFLSGGSRNRFP